jgi:hypothetical protein
MQFDLKQPCGCARAHLCEPSHRTIPDAATHTPEGCARCADVLGAAHLIRTPAVAETRPNRTVRSVVLMSPADALTLLRMAQRTRPVDPGEAEVLAHLVKLASRIVDIETRSTR